MKFKRLLACITACIIAVSLAACGGSANASSEDDNTITIWATGSDNVRQSYEKIIELYNESHETKAELQFLMSGTGTQTLTDMVAAAYKAGKTNTNYDLIDLSGDDVSKLVSQVGEEAFVKIDSSKIPNAETVEAKSATATDYVQPYRGTTVILAYNSETVPEPPKTMDELVEWIKENPGRFAYNAPGTGGAGDSFARTSVYNFIDDEEAAMSDDEKWIEEWDEGFKFLEELHPYMYQSGGSVVYPNKNQGTLDLLNQGEIDMCPNWADMVLSQRAAGTLNENIKITTIEPSFSGSVQSLAIPTFGSNQDEAYDFINFMLSEEVQTLLVEDMAAIPLIETTNMDMTGFEDLENLDVSKFRTLSIGDLSTSFNERWDNEISTLN